MNPSLSYWRLALRSVRFHWRTQLGACAGVVLASAVLVGALLVGDSVSFSLRQFAQMRLGRIQRVVRSPGRYLDVALAERLAGDTGCPVAPVLMLRGVVTTRRADGTMAQVNQVQIVGVDERFWKMAPGTGDYPLGSGMAAVNRRLAQALELDVGAELSVRMATPSLMPRDAPLASRTEAWTRRGSFELAHVVPDERLGRFSLEANQSAPATVFVDMVWLQQILDLPGRANALLVGESPDGDAEETESMLSATLRRVWTLADVGLVLRESGGVFSLESDRVFLDPAVSRAAAKPDTDAEVTSVGALAYLVDRVHSASGSTPYSFAVALTPSDDPLLGLVPAGMRDDQVIINPWLAGQLGVGAGDPLTVTSSEMVPGGGFVARDWTFTVLRVVPMDAFEVERGRMPDFPGLTDVEQCREWDVGLPMDEEALRDEANQAYWEAHGATPKLAVTLAAGRRMWANPFGDTTAVRYRTPLDREALERAIQDVLDPVAAGLVPVPVARQARRAVDEAMNFGELFVSMSFFLIVAALMLVGMLFVFGVQQRAGEMGLLLAVGYRPDQVRRIFFWEAGVMALVGSVVGGWLGTGYTRLLIWGLAHHWKEAVAGSAIRYHATPGTWVVGVAGSFLCGLLALVWAVWRQARRPARELLTGDHGRDRPLKVSVGARVRTAGLCVVMLLGACGMAVAGVIGGQAHAVYAFFGAGSLLLLSGLAGSRFVLQGLERLETRRLTLGSMGLRNASRCGGRSLTTVALLASGSFLVMAVSSMQQDLAASAAERWSGTGGFELFGEAALPAADALESVRGREAFDLDREASLDGASFVSLKVVDGDDASCFNLNRAQTPRLLGVDPAQMRAAGAFMPKGGTDGVPWSLLEHPLPEGVVPGLAGDANTAMWNLHARTGVAGGDELVYTDERGESFRVRLVGSLPVPLSVFQGVVLIPDTALATHYPSASGYRMFLVDLPEGQAREEAHQALMRRMDRIGLDLHTTLERLESFHAVEAVYLGMFLVLGGIGMLLGTLGLGIVVMRNMLERRPELALLRCVGFSRWHVLWLVLAEHGLLLLLGLGCGVAAAAVAIMPSLAAPGMDLPVGLLVCLAGSILIVGIGASVVAALVSLQGDPIPALRRE